METLGRDCKDNIERVSSRLLSVDEFRQRFEIPAIPCIITGCVDDLWALDKNWTWRAFLERYGSTPMKIAEDDQEKKIKLPVRDYYKYLVHQKDDSPLYMFQAGFTELEGTSDLLDKYTVPKYFKDDIFGAMSENKRPPYRWFLIGPQRSGTTLHADPLGTSAWNTSLNGHKLWVLFPPTFPKWVVSAKNIKQIGEDTEAIDYFGLHLPRMLKKEGPIEGMIQCIQSQGDTIFVPGGWWHAVLNLDDTMAVTQNYCSTSNFDQVWRHIRIQRHKLCKYFLYKLKRKHLMLYRRALQLNASDKFIPPDMRLESNSMLDVSTDSLSNSSSDSDSSSSKSLTDSEENTLVQKRNLASHM